MTPPLASRKILRRLLAPVPLLAGCSDTQSVFAPAGPHAERVLTHTWILFGGGAAILAFVMALLAFAILAPPERRVWLGRRDVIIWLGIAFPVVTLSALLIHSSLLFRGLALDPGPPAVRVEIIGERFWWRVNYLDEDGKTLFVTANEVRVPVDRSVEYILHTRDVIHSFWVPNLAGKLDMIPGHTNSYRFVADRPGVFRGQCTEFCGEQHTYMAFYFAAMPEPAFEEWARRQAQPARAPDTPLLERGEALFHEAGCGVCHVVRGTRANGWLGPDLTHVGSRISLAAGILPNTIGALAGWISSAQHLKPDNRMPSFGGLDGEDLRAIAAYLESLQ